MIPVMGVAGINGAIHSSEIDAQDNILGKNCVELELDHLGAGSVIGAYSMLLMEPMSIQIKALERTYCMTISRSFLSSLRKKDYSLNIGLKKLEA
mmetsp:Transcript_16445/g.2699  ORF Transcript_16445/g.2699 Transcript_16445/m.2699 type:complete len:95 (+) Transcript_16445:363-647(+)